MEGIQKSLPLNSELTAQLQSSSRVLSYLKWAKDNGALFDKITVPAVFGTGLTGVACREQVDPQEVFVAIPNSMLITLETAYESEIGHVFAENEYLFKGNADGDSITMVVYLMYEHCKGE